MARPKAAQRAAAQNVAPLLAALLNPARAEASRKNGAKSRGPRTPEGKQRSSRNALKHGLCAEKHVVVAGESAEAFTAFEAALLDDLAPQGALQTLLAGRIARAAWRLERAERIEAELFAREMDGPFGDGDLGLALIRDGNGARAFDTLVRYRGAAQAELFRTLRTLKALQAEAARETTQQAAMVPAMPEHAAPALPNKPEPRANLGESRADAASGATLPVPDPAAPCADPAPDGRTDAPGYSAAVSSETPIEPENRRNLGESQATAAGRTGARHLA